MAQDMEFNEEEYLAANPDVAVAILAGHFIDGYSHYKKFGKNEGRMLKKLFGLTPRERAVFHLINKKGLGLEVGPSHNPIAPKKAGYNVHILDHASADELRAKYQGHNVNLDNIEEVDYVWRGQPLQELIGDEAIYDWIIASHVIEHVPDFVSYIQQCEKLLTKNGVLSLVIPDKRYCFDYFSPATFTGEILDAYLQKRTRPTSGQVFNHIANASKKNDSIAWGASDKGGATQLVHEFSEASNEWHRSLLSDDYIDVHCWRFTPASFRLIISDLANLNLTNLEIKAEFDTNGCEFYVTLGHRSESITKRLNSRFDSLRAVKDEY